MKLNPQFFTALAVAVVVAVVVGRVSSLMNLAQRLHIGASFLIGGTLAVAVFGSPFEDRE